MPNGVPHPARRRKQFIPQRPSIRPAVNLALWGGKHYLGQSERDSSKKGGPNTPLARLLITGGIPRYFPFRSKRAPMWPNPHRINPGSSSQRVFSSWHVAHRPTSMRIAAAGRQNEGKREGEGVGFFVTRTVLVVCWW